MTRLEQQLEQARTLVNDLEVKVLEEKEQMLDVTPSMMLLAVRLHSALCDKNHLLNECNWEIVTRGSEPEQIDWTLEMPAHWLKTACAAIREARSVGYTVTEPGITQR